MNFLKRLFGWGTQPEPAKPAPRSTASSAPTAAPVPAPRKLVLTWQEMLDSQARIAGYLLRPAAVHSGYPLQADDLLAALDGERVRDLAERRFALIPLRAVHWRSTDFRGQIGPNTAFVIEEAATDDLLTVLGEMRAAGARVALRGECFAGGSAWNGLVDFLLFNLRDLPLQSLEGQIRQVRQSFPSVRVVVDGVDSWDEQRLLLSLGVAYCLGSFATQPENLDAGQIHQSRLVVIDMLNLLRAQADLAEVAAVAKRDPAVVVKLLEMANSPLSGLSRQVVSIEEAMMLLGRDALYRWLALSMFRIGAQGGRDETLLVIALMRAYFLEALAVHDRRRSSELFLVGLLSVMDALLNLPIDKVVGKMRLPDEVVAALQRREGALAPYLALALKMERCEIPEVLILAGHLELDSGALFAAYRGAVAIATAGMPG